VPGERRRYRARLGRFATLELQTYPRRVVTMGAVALGALAFDLLTKHVAVAVEPGTLLFNVSDRAPFELGWGLIFVVAACSLLACVLPVRVVAVGAGLALGGALGNLISRRLWADRGGSPDFIRFSDGSTGNVADLLIVTGGAAMLLGALVWLGRTLAADRRRR
jgi:hypothetical protein